MYDIIRKKSTAYFVLFFRFDVELFMRVYIDVSCFQTRVVGR